MTREEIIAANPLVEYCEKIGLEFRREGHEWVCLCPLHDEHTPSFKVNPENQVFHCFRCGAGGSVIDLHMGLRGLSNGEAMRELSNGNVGNVANVSTAPQRVERKRVAATLPLALPWDRDFAQRIADSRKLHITAVEFAFLWLQTLAFVHFYNVECWVLRDRSRRCIEARRVDREEFPESANVPERKAHTFRGYSDKSWPVGILPPGFEDEWLRTMDHKILLVEGGPDYLAACHIIAESPQTDFDNALPVAILGAGNRNIADDALPYFIGRQTTVVVHGEDAGYDAADGWARQIQGAGGSAQVLYLNQGTDLCDTVAGGATYDDIRLF